MHYVAMTYYFRFKYLVGLFFSEIFYDYSHISNRLYKNLHELNTKPHELQCLVMKTAR